MNKQAFLADQDVENFLAWLARELPQLKIRLDIKRSRFVPSGSDIGRLLLQIDASDLFDPLSKKLESRLALCNDHVVSRVQEQWSRDS